MNLTTKTIMECELEFYKEDGRWYANVPTMPKEENEMVFGADTFLEKVSMGHKKVFICFSDIDDDIAVIQDENIENEETKLFNFSKHISKMVFSGTTPSSIPRRFAIEPAITLRTITSIGICSTTRHNCLFSSILSTKWVLTPFSLR
mgnify:CR=1 FL=1